MTWRLMTDEHRRIEIEISLIISNQIGRINKLNT